MEVSRPNGYVRAILQALYKEAKLRKNVPTEFPPSSKDVEILLSSWCTLTSSLKEEIEWLDEGTLQNNIYFSYYSKQTINCKKKKSSALLLFLRRKINKDKETVRIIFINVWTELGDLVRGGSPIHQKLGLSVYTVYLTSSKWSNCLENQLIFCSKVFFTR